MDIPINYIAFKINILKKVFLIASIVSVITFLVGQASFAVGFFVGGLMSALIFSLLYKYVLALQGLSGGQRKKFIIPRSLFIYIIMGLTLAIAIKKGLPVFLGAAAGLLSLKMAIFIHMFQEKHAGA